VDQRVQKDLLVHKDQVGLRATQDQSDQLDIKVEWVLLVSQVHRGHQVQRVIPVQLDRRDQQETRVHKDHREHQDQQVLLVNKDSVVHKVTTDFLVFPVS